MIFLEETAYSVHLPSPLPIYIKPRHLLYQHISKISQQQPPQQSAPREKSVGRAISHNNNPIWLRHNHNGSPSRWRKVYIQRGRASEREIPKEGANLREDGDDGVCGKREYRCLAISLCLYRWFWVIAGSERKLKSIYGFLLCNL